MDWIRWRFLFVSNYALGGLEACVHIWGPGQLTCHKININVKIRRRSAEVDKKCTAATIYRRGFRTGRTAPKQVQ